MAKQYTGWPALAVAILALGQRLGGYENKRLAILLLVVASALLIAFLVFSVRDLLRWNKNRLSQKAAADSPSDHSVFRPKVTIGGMNVSVEGVPYGRIDYGHKSVTLTPSTGERALILTDHTNRPAILSDYQELIRQAPRILLSYRRGAADWERFSFRNEGSEDSDQHTRWRIDPSGTECA